VTKQECIVEASHSNVFAVMRNAVTGKLCVVTPPQENILPGITRLLMHQRTASDKTLQAHLAAAGVDTAQGTGGLIEAPIPLAGLEDGSILELFVTASTTFVMPIVCVDGKPVGPLCSPQPSTGSMVDPLTGEPVCHSYLPGDKWVKGSVGPVAEAYRLAWLRWWNEDREASKQNTHATA
jgi:branched-subunit amino acid aminotransferase/4-amino-4-deoxychorismate lyase